VCTTSSPRSKKAEQGWLACADMPANSNKDRVHSSAVNGAYKGKGKYCGLLKLNLWLNMKSEQM